MKNIKELETELKAATQEIKYLNKRKRSASFKSLSHYSQNLFQAEYEGATEKQMDIIMKLSESGLSAKELTPIIRRATK